MKIKYILPLLATLGVAQAVVNATFSYREWDVRSMGIMINNTQRSESDCENLLRPDTPYRINDDRCITDVGNAKSFYMSVTKKHRTICLEKYQGERCKEAPAKQPYDWLKSGECISYNFTGELMGFRFRNLYEHRRSRYLGIWIVQIQAGESV